nr:hypothetical protein Iba_chr04bCG16180 [Ipomoea batatas]
MILLTSAIRLSLALVTAPQALVGVGGPGVATRISRRRRAGFAASPPLQATVIASSSMETCAPWALRSGRQRRREEARHLNTSSVFGALCIVSEDDVLLLSCRLCCFSSGGLLQLQRIVLFLCVSVVFRRLEEDGWWY